MSDLRQKIADLFDDATLVTIALGADMASFDVAVHLAPRSIRPGPNSTPGRPLGTSICSSNVTTRVIERSCRRRVVSAKIIAATESAA